jgi:hypothetical protein
MYLIQTEKIWPLLWHSLLLLRKNKKANPVIFLKNRATAPAFFGGNVGAGA